MTETRTTNEAQSVERYFAGRVRDCDSLFKRAISRVLLQKAVQERTDVVHRLLAGHGLAGKHVLDLGCGTGRVAIAAARLGASVTGLDIVRGMVEVARSEATRAGVSDRTDFRVHDITQPYSDSADVTVLLGVIEYYSDVQALLRPAAVATREVIVIQDTNGPCWRRMLRHAVARTKRLYLRYRDPQDIVDVMRGLGFVETVRLAGGSFTIMTFGRATIRSSTISRRNPLRPS